MANVSSLKNELMEPKQRPSSPASVMRNTLNSKSVQELLNETIHANRDAFVASLIDLYSSDSNLAKCNPGLVVREALKAVSLPAAEVHLSNIYDREDFRHISYPGKACVKTVYGKGFAGYEEAICFLKNYIQERKETR